MHEIELKFGIPPERLTDVRTALRGLGADLDHPQILQAAYFDTVDRRLARARSALRVRREDDDWVQTFKSAGINAMMRVEDNQPAAIPAPGQALAPDLSRHQGVARETLMHHLAWAPDQDPAGTQCGLVALYRTDLHRTRARLAVQHQGQTIGEVELALDEGVIASGPLEDPVSELEIELLQGEPLAVILAGRAWAERFGLWLDTQTKAHRGDRLARQVQPPPADATASSKAAAPTPSDWRAELARSLQRITTPMSALAAGNSASVARSLQDWRQGLAGLNTLLCTPETSSQPWAAELHSTAQSLAQRLEALDELNKHTAAAEARSAQSTNVCLDVLTALLP